MASIDFTDGTGAASITMSDDGKTTARFNRWRPLSNTIGERANALGDGRLYQFVHRVDYRVSFEMPRIPYTQQGILHRFMLHAYSGGIFEVHTDDLNNRSYAECQLAPEASVEVSDPDPENLEYTLQLDVINVAGTPSAFICEYP